jgi:DNA-binding LacI/PurR family transcriptional regulator
MLMSSVTIVDIARICGVGVTTVSRAINNHPDINQETKEMIMKVIKQYNYVPNNSARNLKRSASQTIAVLAKGIANPFFSRIIQLINQEIEKKRYSFHLQHVEHEQDEIEVAIELIKEKRLKGIVFLGGLFSHSQEKLTQLNVPFVLSTIGITDDFERDSHSFVAVDDAMESFKMVDYLCGIGHRDIAIIASPGDQSIGDLRLQGYKQALEKHHIPYREELVREMKEDVEKYSMANGYAVTKELLESGWSFTAVYAISDVLAIGACRALLEAGIRVPDDCSVAGFDGLDISYYYNPSISTIKQPVDDIARETIRILFQMIEKKITHGHRLFPAELVVRESTKPRS